MRVAGIECVRLARHAEGLLMDAVQSRLAEVALAAREIIEMARAHQMGFEDFPAGTCGPTAELLGRYLKEALGLDAMYVNGVRAGKSHAWVEVDGVIIDITADQFDEVQDAVIVTRERSWHEEWERYDEPRPPICSPQQWGMYPYAIWGALVEGLAERGFPRPKVG